MKHFLVAAAALSLLATSAAFAQPERDRHDDHPAPAMMMKGPAPAMHGGPSMMMKGPDRSAHAGWRKGGHIEQTDWRRGEKVDYRSHHLAKPRRGYEWRQVDGNFVLAAAATGLIASIIAANH